MSQPNTTQQQARFSGLAASLLDLLFPPRCANCGCVDYMWCDRCQDAYRQIPISNPNRLTLPGIDVIATTGNHRGQLQRLIQALKYEDATGLARPLAFRLSAQAKRQGWHSDAVIAVPLHPTRQQQRGYNQSQLLAAELAKRLGIPVLEGAAQRVSFTRSQVGLGRAERQANVADAFHADATLVSGKRLILVDDVLTTGATLAACGGALRLAGADAVFGLTVTAAALN